MKKNVVRRWISDHLIISTSNYFYQVWKMLVIVVSFASSFQYAYFACFLSRMTEEEYLNFRSTNMVFQSLFAANMIVTIFVEHQFEAALRVERDIVELVILYLKGRFSVDMATIFPFDFFLKDWLSVEYLRLFLLIKLLRLYTGFELLDYKVFMMQIKRLVNSRIQSIIESDPERALSQVVDQAKITQLILMQYFLKSVQLIMILVCLSYMTGMLWLIACDHQSRSEKTFIVEYSLAEKDLKEITISLVYFMFTTLSTVGLGDMHPINSFERIIGSVVMLFGVLMTSFVMENFSQMIKHIKGLD